MTPWMVFAAGLGLLAWMLPGSLHADATSWPERPVKLVLPYQPGGATDLIARPWSERLSQALGQPVVIENRGGASGVIGTEAVVKAAPDGYTLLLTPNGPLTVNPNFRKVPYDPLRSLVCVGRVGDLINGFAVHPSTGIKTLTDLVAQARANPGKLAFGSAGLGTNSHLRLERFKHKMGIDILHVPYRGNGDAINDLLSGTIQIMNEINPMPHVKAGKLVLLNISWHQRHPDFPDVPTDRELGIEDARVLSWYAIFAPAGTPEAIVRKLNARMVEIARDPEMARRMLAINVALPVQSPDEMAAFLAEDLRSNAEIIRAAGLKLE